MAAAQHVLPTSQKTDTVDRNMQSSREPLTNLWGKYFKIHYISPPDTMYSHCMF
jgi:hypothetical protein